MFLTKYFLMTYIFFTYKTSLKADKEDWGVIFLGSPAGGHWRRGVSAAKPQTTHITKLAP